MKTALYSFPESRTEAEQLATQLGILCLPIDLHRFPDGESLIRITAASTNAIIYRSLDRPNEKLVELMLAASALRDGGARQVILVAPYLAYMRQDMAFRSGEAVSQRIIGQFIATYFDALLTVDPHLHRISSLAKVVPGKTALAISAASTLARLLKPDVTPDTLLVGPDEESRQWVESVAAPLGTDFIIGTKQRLGDRHVELVLPDIHTANGRPAVLVDDMISSGGTLLHCANQLLATGATSVEAVTVHCLASQDDLDRLLAGGIKRIRSTDCVPGPTAVASIAPAIAATLKRQFPELFNAMGS